MRPLLFLIPLFLLFACSTKQKGEAVKETTPLVNFWDTIRVDSASLKMAEVEQSFANFVALLGRDGDSTHIANAVTSLLQKSCDEGSLTQVLELADHYLYDPNSPLLNEDLYMPFLEAYLTMPNIGKAEEERTRFTISRIHDNRPGTLPPDFGFVMRDGFTTTLRNYSQSMAHTLVVFYDPECENCKGVIEMMKEDEHLNRAIEQGNLRVLAVYAEGDTAVWKHSSSYIPSNWRDVCVEEEPEKVLDEYNVRARPTLYLIAPDGRISLKDAQPEKLLQFLRHH